MALAARDAEKLRPLADETGALVFAADASKSSVIEDLFTRIDHELGAPDLVIYNASSRVPGPLASVDPGLVEQSLAVTAFGAFLVAQQAAKRMEPKGRGAILFTGATAGIKGFARSAPFAMGKFALRGLAQSAARELGPKELDSWRITAQEEAAAGRASGGLWNKSCCLNKGPRHNAAQCRSKSAARADRNDGNPCGSGGV